MRVLHLLHSLRRGGLERVVVSVANGLNRRRVPQGVCCLHGPGPLLGALDPDVARFVLGARPNDPTLAFRLQRVYRLFRPDVIHTVDFCSWPDATLAAVLSPSIGRVHTFHGFLSRPAARWRWMGRLLARCTDVLQAVSRDAARQAAEHFRVSADRIEVIPNGVDVVRFDPHSMAASRAALGLPEDGLVCVTVGSLTPAKNPLLLVAAARGVRPDVHFVWVGEGPLAEAVQEEVARAGLAHRFTLAGGAADVRPWLASADLFVLPSDTEAAPLSLLEAMAMQLPVVATRVGEVPDMVGDQAAGLLVAPGDAAGLAAAVNALARDDCRRRRMAICGRGVVLDRFNQRQVLDRYEQTYEEFSSARHRRCRGAAVPLGGCG